MEDILNKRMIESVGKDVKLVLQNGYIYSGKITNCDEKYLEILDSKTQTYHVIDLTNIKDVEIKNE